MSTGRGVQAGKAFILLSIRDVTTQSLRNVERRLASFGQRVAQIGRSLTLPGVVGGGGLFALLLREASESEQAILKMQQAFGPLAERASEFADKLGREVGRSGEEIRNQFADIQAFLTGTGFEALPALGLSDQIARLAQDFSGFKIGAVSAEEATSGLIRGLRGSGRALADLGIKLGPSDLKLFSEALEGTTQEAVSMQAVMDRLALITSKFGQSGITGAAVRQANTLKGLFLALRESIGNIADAALQPLRDIFVPILNCLRSASDAIADFVGKNQAFTRNLLALAGVATVVGPALIGIGLGFFAIGHAIGPVLSIASLLTTAFSGVVGTLAALGPGLLVIGGIAIALALNFTNLRQTALETFEGLGSIISETFSGVFDFASGVIKGIADLLTVGELGKAAELAGASFSLAFQVAFLAVEKTVRGFATRFLATIENIREVAARVFVDIGRRIQIAFVSIPDAIADAFVAVGTFLEDNFDEISIAFGRMIARVGTALEGLAPEEVVNRLKSFGLSEKDAEARRKASDERQAADVLARAERRNAAIDEINRNAELAGQDVSGEFARRRREIEETQARAIGESQRKVNAARDRFAAAMEAAAQVEDEAAKIRENVLGQFEKSIAGVGPELSKTVRDNITKSQGTFEARLIPLLGFGRAADTQRQILQEQKKTTQAVNGVRAEVAAIEGGTFQ